MGDMKAGAKPPVDYGLLSVVAVLAQASLDATNARVAWEQLRLDETMAKLATQEAELAQAEAEAARAQVRISGDALALATTQVIVDIVASIAAVGLYQPPSGSTGGGSPQPSEGAAATAAVGGRRAGASQ